MDFEQHATHLTSGATCSTVKSISIRELHTETEDSDLGLVTWTFEGRVPTKGNASEIWKEAKEKKQLFKIESHSFGPPDCRWRITLEAEFSSTEPHTYVSMWVAPVASAIPSPGQSERIFRQGAWCIRNGDITLFNKPGRQAVRDVGLEDTWGFDYAFEIQNLDDPFLSSPFLTCSVSLAIQASRYGSRAPFALNDQYLISNKYSDVTLEIKGQMSSLTIPAHKTILAASSVFFRSKFDFDETSGVTGHTSHCIIEGFSVPCIRAMLEFMYTRQIARYMPANLDWKLQLIPACEYFQVTGMHEYIAPYIFQHMGPENVVKILGMGYGYRMWSDVLAKGAASCLRSHWPELLSKEGFGDSLNVEGFGDWSVLAKYALQGE